MYLLPHKYVVQSEKNGPITVQQFLNRVTVYAGGFEQTGPYVTGLWRTALRKVAGAPVKRVLLLGLGGGRHVREVEKAFPNAAITAIEWDPAMVAIAKKVAGWHTEPTIVVGDVYDVVPTLPSHAYDLICIDAFFGDTPEPRIAEGNTLQALQKILAPNGTILINISRHLEFISAFEQVFSVEEVWKFKQNTCVRASAKH